MPKAGSETHMHTAPHHYVVATVKPWNIAAFHAHFADTDAQWHLINTPEQLTIEALEQINPRYIFFPHWSWKVPEEIFTRWECVCFHMSDVPYGRGGSPLQNLIARGHTDTMLSALRMVEAMDAGPVYAKTPLLLEGRAQDIFERASTLAFTLMQQIAADEPTPAPQEGEAVTFTRRTPEMSALPTANDITALYNHIRMLDAESYPRAFVELNGLRLEFSDASLDGDSVTATVRITPENAPHASHSMHKREEEIA